MRPSLRILAVFCLALARPAFAHDGPEHDIEELTERIAKEGNHRVVLMGHTHKTDIEYQHSQTPEMVYINTGFWFGTPVANCGVVESFTDGRIVAETFDITPEGNPVASRKFPIPKE